MLKRLVGVITVKDGWAVQSIGYGRYLPLGRPEIIAENLDRWFLDEILVSVIDRSPQNAGPDMELVSRIATRNLMTPLAYGGGVRGAEDALELVKRGADRICLEALFERGPDQCRAVRDAIGIQATIRALPVIKTEQGVGHYSYLSGQVLPVDPLGLQDAANPIFSELLVIDKTHDGGDANFDETLITPFANAGYQIIAFGGISAKTQVQSLFANPHVSGVAVGNSLSYRELANRDLVSFTEMHDTRYTTHGEQTKGAREW